MNELFRSTLGLDFIFTVQDGRKIALCIEINGEDSGLKAVETIPDGYISKDDREKVRNRMIHTPERIALSAYAESLDPLTQSEARKEAWKKARSVPGFIHAFQNPKYIRNIVANKMLQQEFIPQENRPRGYVKGKSATSSTGFWICKPIGGRKGKGIKILSNADFETSFVNTDMKDSYLAQELVKACGAERALPATKNNPASMRLLMDFIYRTDGTIQEVFSFAYQRISPYSPETENSDKALEETFVVNAARGATAMSASENEFNLAHAVALNIIKNIAAKFRP